MNQPLTPLCLIKAQRNALAVKWLCALPSYTAHFVAQEYANWAKIPVREVVLDYITDQESLDWVWARYERDIREASFFSP
jgi:hypothetical protein